MSESLQFEFNLYFVKDALTVVTFIDSFNNNSNTENNHHQNNQNKHYSDNNNNHYQSQSVKLKSFPSLMNDIHLGFVYSICRHMTPYLSIPGN